MESWKSLRTHSGCMSDSAWNLESRRRPFTSTASDICRVAAAPYNTLDDYDGLGEAMRFELRNFI